MSSTPQGKRKAPADFSKVRNKSNKKTKDPGYADGIKNYIQDACYAGQQYNQLKIQTPSITEKALDDPEMFCLQLEQQFEIGKVKYLDAKEETTDAFGETIPAKPGTIVIDVYGSKGLNDAKELFESHFKDVKLAKTGGHWTIREQKLMFEKGGNECYLHGPSRILYNHLNVIKNSNGDTGRWSEEKRAWVIAVCDPSDPDDIECDLQRLMDIVGFKLVVKWWSRHALHTHPCANADQRVYLCARDRPDLSCTSSLLLKKQTGSRTTIASSHVKRTVQNRADDS